jgi:NAD(P)-dependent dehydrogenase (short-subunit alcohol dehydrogenase family)
VTGDTGAAGRAHQNPQEAVVTRYLVTGATGFLGSALVERLLRRPDAEVFALVRKGSRERLRRLAAGLEGGQRLTPVTGDLSQEGLGLTDAAVRKLGHVDHLVHLAALYDMTASDERNHETNVEGTHRVVDLAARLGVGVLHHVSSVAVAGDHRGLFDETMFDVGQRLPSPYHRTKFEAEQLVRSQDAVPWRVYRPAIVVGDSRTGAIDKVDGPYYFFPTLAALAATAGVGRLPIVLPDLGATNVVPVDYVADALDALIHRPGLDGRAFHLVHPRPQSLTEVYNAFAAAAGAPPITVTLPRLPGHPLDRLPDLLGRIPGARTAAEVTFARLGIPMSVVPHLTFPSTFGSAATRLELDAADVAEPPELASYAPVLWRYWAERLDPVRARRPRAGGPLVGRTVAVTGASSGIGRAAALQIAAKGGIPLLLARRVEELEKVKAEIEAAGGRADVYSVDLTSQDSVDAAVKQMLADHDAVDMLVNNAGRSIRRSVTLSYDRFHDYERTMALNYFGPLRLMLALLPSMTRRRFGHIVNVSSIGVQTSPPRFGAYVASKAALDAFSRVVASELVGAGVSFTTIHMPLVRTPMIAPTKIYDRFPTLTPEEAGGLIVRALEKRPTHIGTKVGLLGAVAGAVTPKIADAVLHTAYLVFPDSAAAGGSGRRTSTPDALSRGAVAMMRLLPGIHW